VTSTECWRVPHEAAGERLDRYLADHYDVPRNRVQSWIREGRVAVNGVAARPSQRLREGEGLSCSPRSIEQPEDLLPEQGPLALLHEDADIVVLNKPAGLVVHPGAGRERGTLVHRLLWRYPEIAQVGGAGRPGIVHRLDRGTTGVLVIARSERAYAILSTAFAERRIDKIYLAVAYGSPRPPQGLVELAVGRHPRRRKEMAVAPAGRPARTRYRAIAAAAGISVLRVGLETGRTHQIRVHLKAIGHPLVGDPVYGEARWRSLVPPARRYLEGFARPALHAWRIAFDHPRTGGRTLHEAPIPADLLELWGKVTGSAWPAIPAE
jgi:23S rRNA pseudouridine1911/1915/1917 synthase